MLPETRTRNPRHRRSRRRSWRGEIASPSPSPTPAKRPESAKPRVSEIGVVPGDVFFDSSDDDDVDPPLAPRSGDEGGEAPGEKRSPMRSDPAPAKKPARTVRPGGVLWSDSDED
jgi:hypothetical protein